MNSKPVYIFDLDGTLIDSMPSFTWGMLSILDDEGIAYPPELIKKLTALGYVKSAEFYVAHMGVKDTVENIVARIKARMVDLYANKIKLKPGVEAYLRRLHAEGARLFVLTASPHLVTDINLKNNGVYDLFEQVWSVEDFGLDKSDTRIFHLVAETVGCPEAEIHYFDDNVIAIENSTKAGYDTYAVLDRQEEADIATLRATGRHFVETFEEM